MQACVAQQKVERGRSNRLRQRIVTKLERLDAGTQERWSAVHTGDAVNASAMNKYAKTERH
eukprot:scaffold113379_cov87-Phaeocystis_antarctica.AAC.1